MEIPFEPPLASSEILDLKEGVTVEYSIITVEPD